jgi:maltokinase
VHRDLAAAFGVREVSAGELQAAAHRMHEQLDEAVEAVPELASYTEMISGVFDDLAKLDRPLSVQRIHGDYHLGQVLRTDRRWVVLDFEGEPARPAAQRRAPAHPLRDVAGMLRSFEYAARFLLADRPRSAAEEARLEAMAREWADRNRSAFCRGYAEAGGPDPMAHRVLLHAFELDKAVYEVLYEARHRPSWLAVPLGSLSHRARH